MKPPSKRHPDVLVRPPDGLSSTGLASVLAHENRLLRARLEGRGRIEVDPAIRRELETATAENRRLTAELKRATAELDRGREAQTELRRRVQQQNQQLPNVVNRVAGLAEQVNRQNDRLAQLSEQVHAGAERAALARESSEAAGRIADLEAELDRTRSELAQARSDLDRLLTRLGSTPLVLLLRRTAGFRAIESRWAGR
ncbi:MAG: hypothetical protein OEW83_20095 [Acidimicrobiia bacterium]|nr:hypothetical protein [Acidimicrobiia bacterium]